MENKYDSKWSCAAKEGLMLAAITVVCSTLTVTLKIQALQAVLWLVQLVGSIWFLKTVMSNYGKAHVNESTFGYGFLVCFFSSIVCAVWAFILPQYICTDMAAEAFGQIQLLVEQSGQEMPDEFNEAMGYVEDNYAKIRSLSTLFNCLLIGLIFSGILNGRTSVSDIFAENSNE